MKTGFSDILSSYGMMLFGIIMLFFSSVIFPAENNYSFFMFPASGKNLRGAGGDLSAEILPVSHPAAPIAKNKGEYAGLLTAGSAVVIDSKTRSILFSKNINDVHSLASITKLMSALVLMDLPIDWSSTAVVLDSDYDGSDHHVQVGEKYTLADLWNIGLVGSSNTAINALVRSSGLAKEDFVKKMNDKAKELRLFSARFDEPTGLSEKNMSNIMDAAKLLLDALKFEKIYATLQKAEYYAKPLNGKVRTVWSTNWLLTNWIPNNFSNKEIAGKTGFINDSGYNFAVSLSRGENRAIIAVVFGASSNEARFTEARDLAEWVFAGYVWPDDPGYLALTPLVLP